MNKKKWKNVFLPLTTFFLLSTPLYAYEREGLLFMDVDDVLVTATKYPQKISEAPAIASVIAAKEIRNMGARDIIDVLNRVPGIHVTKGYYGKEEIEVRGIKTTNSEKVKMLIDGHSINDNWSGGPVWGFDGLSLDNVKRIEIIRGPGSALYGSNAFSAVINVITKDGTDIDGVIVSAGGGSFDTGRFNLQAGKKFDDLEVALALDYLKTDGPRLHIDSDLLGMSGDTKDFEDKVEGSLKLKYKDFAFNAKYVTRNRETYLGVGYAINDESRATQKQFFSELSYTHDLNKDSRIIAKAYIDELHSDSFVEILPESFYPPDGMLGQPLFKERTLGGELQYDYELLETDLTVGFLKERRKQFDVRSFANFNPNNNAPLGSFQDITSWANHNKNETRNIWATYIQDVWSVTEDVDLTVGVRHDDYSDSGSTTNPRAAIVWNFEEGWDLKLLYGKAFRAPSFEELYNDNNPAVDGNSNLKAEKMKTYEVSIGHSYNDDTKARITYFNNTIEDRIKLLPVGGTKYQFFNQGGARVRGIETEWKRSFSSASYVYLNYTYQRTKDKETGKRLPDVAPHKGNVGVNIKLNNNFNVNTNVFLTGRRPRDFKDTRSSAPGYALVDLTLIAKELYKTLEIRTSVHNLLNKKYSDPAPLYEASPPGSGNYLPTVSGDFPRAGINLMLEAMYKF